MNYVLENQRHKLNAQLRVGRAEAGYMWEVRLSAVGARTNEASRRTYKHEEIAASDALIALSKATAGLTDGQKQVLDLWLKQTFRDIWKGTTPERREEMKLDEFTRRRS